MLSYANDVTDDFKRYITTKKSQISKHRIKVFRKNFIFLVIYVYYVVLCSIKFFIIFQ